MIYHALDSSLAVVVFWSLVGLFLSDAASLVMTFTWPLLPITIGGGFLEGYAVFDEFPPDGPVVDNNDLREAVVYLYQEAVTGNKAAEEHLMSLTGRNDAIGRLAREYVFAVSGRAEE